MDSNNLFPIISEYLGWNTTTATLANATMTDFSALPEYAAAYIELRELNHRDMLREMVARRYFSALEHFTRMFPHIAAVNADVLVAACADAIAMTTVAAILNKMENRYIVCAAVSVPVEWWVFLIVNAERPERVDIVAELYDTYEDLECIVRAVSFLELPASYIHDLSEYGIDPRPLLALKY